MPARLIINADDFGLTPGINRAVLELHQAGALSSATLMACSGAFAEAAAIARQHPRLGVGCHLVFVDGTPLSPPEMIPSLLGGNGISFRPTLLAFAQAVLRGAVQPEELAREAKAQVERLLHAGCQVTHLDTHKHTHLLPAVTRTLLQVAAECGVPCIRNPFEPHWASSLSRDLPQLPRRLSVTVLETLSPLFHRELRNATAVATTAGTLGITATGFLSQALLEAWLKKLLSLPGDQTYELCVHPGRLDPALDAIPTRLRASREAEFFMLMSTVPQLLAKADAPQLIHFGDLSAGKRPASVPRTIPRRSD